MSADDSGVDRDPPRRDASLSASTHLPEPEASHLRPVSPVAPAPARMSSFPPDVQVELIQPGVEDLQTPRAPDTVAPHDSAFHLDAEVPSDYFSATSHHPQHAAGSPPTARRESVSTAPLSRQTSHSSTSPEARSNDVISRVEASLARSLAAPRDKAASTANMVESSDPVDEVGMSLRLRPHRSLTEHPPSTLSHEARGSSPEEMASSRTSGNTRHRPRPLNDLRGPSAERQARTTGNTPLQTPHLYAPRAAAPAFHPPYLSQGAFPSPYLHPAQPQAPKETSKATRDIDTFSGRKTINQYEIQSEIGKGTHGKVKLARNLDNGEYVAIKIVQRYSKKRRLGKATSQEDQVKKEVAILKKALHPNVVSMIEVIDDPDLHKIYLVLEFCELHDVKWRTPGESEILLMEHRRLQREMHGDSSLDVPAESEGIIQKAMRRRDKAFRKRRAPLSRINSNEDFCWSLEYAGESEDDDDGRSDSGPISRTSSRPESKIIGTNANQKEASELKGGHSAVSGDAPPTAVEDFGLDLSKPAAVLQESDDVPEQSRSWDMSGFYTHLQQRLHDADDAGRPRKASVAESSASQLTEMMEYEIDDEERRYVPLLTIAESRRAFRDGLLGLEYLHYQGIVHRDIKPENLLRKADQSVKISDFGVSYLGKPQHDGRESEDTSENEGPDHEEETELAKTVGTPAFYAPELCTLQHVGEKPRVTGQIDVWALGIVLYCLLYARLPFQANNEFVMMRRIAEDEVFISRKRLKAILPNSSRQAPYSRAFVSAEHRLPHELSYEDIDDDLYDLLKRLFQKDPTKRITVKEIKHHPWTLRDIPSPLAWQEETDPARFTQGKKIEISKEEVADAVIPLKILERAKSVAKKVGGVLGLGTGKPARKRGQSSANSSDVSPTASVSGHSLSGRRRESMQSDDGALGALRMPPPFQSPVQHQHHDHPLSQSVTASPDASTTDRSFETALRQGSLREDQSANPKRPTLSARQESSMSTTGSIKTIRQSDIHGMSIDQAIDPHPDDPQHHHHHHHSHKDMISGAAALGAIFGGAGRSIMRSISRSRRGSDARASSTPPSPRAMEAASHLHGEPSTAVTNASAAGLVQQPARSSDALSTSSASASPYQSKRGSIATGISASGLSHAINEATKPQHWPSRSRSPGDSQRWQADRSNEQSEIDFHETRQSLARRKIFDDANSMESSRSASVLSSQLNPPYPDDGDVSWKQVEESPSSSGFLPLSSTNSPSPRPRQHSIKAISSNSSEDRFTSGVSQSTSYPSIPSVVSANSSVVPDDGSLSSAKEESAHSSEGTARADRSTHGRTNPASVTPTGPLVLTETEKRQISQARSTFDSDGDDDDDDGDDGDFLMMNRPKSRQFASTSRRPSAATNPKRHSVRRQPSGSQSYKTSEAPMSPGAS